jgi:endonuclease-3
MGFLALQEAWGINLGIGVDTHVHRLTNRLRWHRKPTNDAEQTRCVRSRRQCRTLIAGRLNLQSWLPKELHGSINKLLVGCVPVSSPHVYRAHPVQLWCASEGTRHSVLTRPTGQTICLPIGPRCDLCHVARVPGLCPSKQAVSPRKPKISPAKAEHLAEPVVKVEVDDAVIEGAKVEGEVLLEANGETLEVRKTEGEEAKVLKHEAEAW